MRRGVLSCGASALVAAAHAIASILLGILLVVGGAATWIVVSNTLSEQNITTPDDACLPEREVSGPFTAYCQAEIIQEHTLEITGGQTYAELERDDPRRARR